MELVQKLYQHDVDTDSNEPYHLRCAYDEENKEIRLCLLEDGEPKTVIITGASPLLGHYKTNDCCQGG